MMRRTHFSLLAAAATLLGMSPSVGGAVEVLPRAPGDYPDPERATRRREKRKLSRDEKRERARRLRLKKGGFPGAGLQRKFAKGKRVRGY